MQDSLPCPLSKTDNKYSSFGRINVCIKYTKFIKKSILNQTYQHDWRLRWSYSKLSFRKKKMSCSDIISVYVFYFILDHFQHISKHPRGSLKQLVDDQNIYYQLLGINPSIFKKRLTEFCSELICPSSKTVNYYYYYYYYYYNKVGCN